jgi:hypothetical protein
MGIADAWSDLRVEASSVSTCPRILRALSTTSCPMDVSENDFASRSIKATPRYSSSFLICVLRVGWDTWQSSVARPKCPRFAPQQSIPES